MQTLNTNPYDENTGLYNKPIVYGYIVTIEIIRLHNTIVSIIIIITMGNLYISTVDKSFPILDMFKVKNISGKVAAQIFNLTGYCYVTVYKYFYILLFSNVLSIIIFISF